MTQPSPPIIPALSKPLPLSKNTPLSKDVNKKHEISENAE
jgi:hypothetical protein